MASEPQGLRMSREVRISDLLWILGALSAAAAGYIQLKVDAIKERVEQIEKARVADRGDNAEFKRELRADMQRVEAKLDRLIEAIPQRTAGGR